VIIWGERERLGEEREREGRAKRREGVRKGRKREEGRMDVF